jgi:hypothetical protein
MMKNWQEMKASIVFVCENFSKTYQQMAANGVSFLEEPNKMALGHLSDLPNPMGMNFYVRAEERPLLAWQGLPCIATEAHARRVQV